MECTCAGAEEMAAAGWDDYYCRVHDEWNQTLGKYVKALQELGKLEIRVVTGDGDGRH